MNPVKAKANAVCFFGLEFRRGDRRGESSRTAQRREGASKRHQRVNKHVLGETIIRNSGSKRERAEEERRRTVSSSAFEGIGAVSLVSCHFKTFNNPGLLLHFFHSFFGARKMLEIFRDFQ